MNQQTQTQKYQKRIAYDRETKDFAMYLDGELVGYARSYLEAEVTLDQLVYNLLVRQSVAVGAEE